MRDDDWGAAEREFDLLDAEQVDRCGIAAILALCAAAGLGLAALVFAIV